MTTINMPSTRFEATREAFLNALNEAVEVKFGALDKIHADYFNKELELINNVPDEWLTTMLIVSDMTKYMKQNYPNCISSGRGAIVGSFAAYLLDITEIDPVVYDLMPERFYIAALTNPIPMIDLDIATNYRETAIEYLMHQYGTDCVLECMCNVYKNGIVTNCGQHTCALFITANPYEGEIGTGTCRVAKATSDELMEQGHMRINLVPSKPQEHIMNLLNNCDTLSVFDPMMFKGLYASLFNKSDKRGLYSDVLYRYNDDIKTFDDIIMVVSMYRGIQTNVRRYFKDADSYGLKEIDSLLLETKGHIVYQEQILKLLQGILNIDFCKANELRKSIAKKNVTVVNEAFSKIVTVLIAKGMNFDDVIRFWNNLVAATSIAPLKAHFVAAAFDTVKCAWLIKQAE